MPNRFLIENISADVNIKCCPEVENQLSVIKAGKFHSTMQCWTCSSMLFKQKISYHLVKAGQISQYISAHGRDLYGIEVANHC